jgi:hypothetical protein
MNGVILQAFIKLNDWFKTQPPSTFTAYREKGITVEDIARDLFLPQPKKLNHYGVNNFRKILGLKEKEYRS